MRARTAARSSECVIEGTKLVPGKELVTEKKLVLGKELVTVKKLVLGKELVTVKKLVLGKELVTVKKPTRVYVVADGVFIPTVTDAEKRTRRAKVRLNRRRRGRNCAPLPRLKPGTDQTFNSPLKFGRPTDSFRRGRG